MNLPGQKPNITQREREATQSFQTSSPKHSSLLSVVKRLCQFCRYHSIHTCLFCGHQFTNPQSLLALVTTTAASHKRQSQVRANSEDSRSRLIPEVLWGLLERKSWIISECESGHQVCRTTEGLRKEQKGRPNICREPCAFFFSFFPFPSTLPFYTLKMLASLLLFGGVTCDTASNMITSLWLLKLKRLISEFRKIQLQVCRCVVAQSSSALEDWRLWWRKWQWIRSARYWGRQGAGIWKAWGKEEKRAVPSLWKQFKGSKRCFPQLGLDEMFLNCRAIGEN